MSETPTSQVTGGRSVGQPSFPDRRPMSDAEPFASAPEIPPPSDFSRRELDAVQRAVLLLAGEHPAHRMALMQAAPLFDAVRPLCEEVGLLPEEVLRRVMADGPAAGTTTGDVIAVLVARCRVAFDEAMADAAGDVSPDPQPPVRAAHPSRPADPVTDDEPVFVHQPWSPKMTTKATRATSARGWRRALHLGPGSDERMENALVARTQAPVRGHRHVVVMSLKGGSGKTTTTVMVGHTFARHRGDRVVALDASPDAGTLAFRLAQDPRYTVRDIIDRSDRLHRYVDVRAMAMQAPSRLEVVPSDLDPGVNRPFSGPDYRRAADLLSRFYSLVITDCGAGVMHDAMGPVLDTADQLVLVVPPALDGVRSAGLTIDWLIAHGFVDLVRDAVVAVNGVRRRSVIDLDDLANHFAERTRTIVYVPHDPHLAEGGPTDLDRLQPQTRRAYLELAATVADGFDASTRRAQHQ
jgi:MinD-like ATPase involved in chromosome partitioning or flagellar assembly